MTEFLIKSTLSMAVLLLLYHLLLEQQKMHYFNRFYLLAALVFSLVLPFISIPVPARAGVIPLTPVQTLDAVIISAASNNVDYLPYFLWTVYGAVTVILSMRYGYNILYFFREAASNQTIAYKKAVLVLLDKPVVPHTFINYIFINRREYESKLIEEELYTHEYTHVRQKHTIDILFIEALKTLFWFNPLFYFYKKAIQLNHEFLADDKVIDETANTICYQNLLLEKASVGTAFSLASNLNFSITKQRFIMMTKRTSRTGAIARQGIAFTILCSLLLLSCTADKTEEAAPAEAKITYNASDVDTQPEYPGGMGAFYTSINQEFKLPEIDEDMTARIMVSFIVNEDGKMSQIKVLRDPGHGLGKEAERVLSQMKEKWEPALRKGKAVRVSYVLPITINIKGDTPSDPKK